MREITLRIPEENYSFFMELVKSLSFVRKVASENVPMPADMRERPMDDEDDFVPRTKEEIEADLIESFKEVELIIAGNKKGRPVQELIDELRDYQR